MTNRRKPARHNGYRAEFLRSRAWFARRDRWFREEEEVGRSLRCMGCGRPASKDGLELHHLDYHGVRVARGRWHAFEAHRDLVPMHPLCHDLVHRLIDRDTVLSTHRNRRAASALAIARLRARLNERTSA